MIIRTEKEKDIPLVNELVRKAFLTTGDTTNETVDYLKIVREKSTFVHELSIVAILEDEIVGHIVLYEMDIIEKTVKHTQLVLSPLSVDPDYFKQGIARTLIIESLKKAKTLGYKAVFLCGDYNLYSKFGFVPSLEYDIYHVNDKDKNAKWSMVKELEEGYLSSINGYINIE